MDNNLKRMKMKRVMLVTVGILIALSVDLSAAVYATVNGAEVNDADIKIVLRATGKSKFGDLSKSAQRKVLDQAIERKLLTEQATKEGIQNEDDFLAALEKIKKNLALEIWMKKEFESVKVSETKMRDFYKKNKDKFVKPEKVKARHILLDTDSEAKKIIKELQGLFGEQLRNKFIEIAKTKSTGPTKKTGGDLGWFSKKQMTGEFRDMAFSLKKGEISSVPVKTQFGYHIVYVEDKKDGGASEFKNVKRKIENTLKLKDFQKRVAVKAKKLREAAAIEYK